MIKNLSSKFFITCMFILSLGIMNAQNINVYGCFMGSPDSITGYSVAQFAKVDAFTANVNVIDTLASVNGILIGAATFDNSCNHYIFIGQQSTGSTVIVLDTSGTVVSQFASDPYLFGLQYDLQNQLFYGLYKDSTQIFKLVNFNPLNGTITVIQSLDVVAGVTIGSITFNSNTTKYIFAGMDTLNIPRLFVTDIPAATITYSSIATGDQLIMLNYDNVSNHLFGLYKNNNINPYLFHFAEFDTLTANVTLLDTLDEVYGVMLNNSVFDQTSSSYIFLGIDTANIKRLYVIDSGSGQIVANQQISQPVVEIECDNTHFAKSFYTNSAGINSDSQTDDAIVYPNPSQGIFNLSFENDLPGDVFITVTNNLNQIVYEKSYNNVSGKFSGKIDLNNIDSGLYYLTVRNGHSFLVKRIIPVIK